VDSSARRTPEVVLRAALSSTIGGADLGAADGGGESGGPATQRAHDYRRSRRCEWMQGGDG